MIYLEFNPNKIPPEYLQAIGLVTASSAHTEELMQEAIAGLAGLDVERGLAITTHMAAPLRDNVLRSLAEIHIDDLDDLDELDEILDNIKSQFEKRNTYVHNQICLNPANGEVAVVKTTARGSVRMEDQPLSLEEIKADARAIYDAGIELFNFLLTKGLLPSLPASAVSRAHKSKAARKKRRKSVKK